MTDKTESVYAKIAKVQAELAKIGIGKTRKNQTSGQNYNFRGIDEVYNTLAPLMAQHGLCILPRIVEHTLSERGKTRNGNAIFSAVVTAEFDFVSADDGSVHVVRTMGEAMDSSDKATNKAMSAAYKYAALMTFAIPTEGDNDADAHTHEVVAVPAIISDADCVLLMQLIQATQSDTRKFCEAFKVGSVKELPEAAFPKAKAMLEKKLAQMAEAAKPETVAEAIDDEIPY
jgi:hypothetical protein